MARSGSLEGSYRNNTVIGGYSVAYKIQKASAIFG